MTGGVRGRDPGGTAGGLSVLLVDRPDSVSSELDTVLGRERAAALETEMTTQVESWGREIARGAFQRATARVALGDEAARILDERPGPLLVVWPCLPRFRPEHGDAALEDLAAGCDLVLGPVIDGGLYLLGLSRFLPDVMVAVEGALEAGGVASGSGAGSLPEALAAATRAGLEVGYLRPERALRSESDLMAARADPLTPEKLARILSDAIQWPPRERSGRLDTQAD